MMVSQRQAASHKVATSHFAVPIETAAVIFDMRDRETQADGALASGNAIRSELKRTEQ
jgi:hypothetical protein